MAPFFLGKMALNRKDFHIVGKIKEAHALRGESYVILFSKTMDWVDQVQELGVGSTPEQVDELRKFKITRENKGALILKFEGVDNRTQAEAMINKYVYIPQEILVSEKGETIFLGEILGFEVFDQGQLIGQVQGISSNGPQDLLIVGENQHLIPFVEDFILNVDFKKKLINMILPPGLISED